MPIFIGFLMVFTSCINFINEKNSLKANAADTDTGTFTKIDATEDLSNLVEGDYVIQYSGKWNKVNHDVAVKAEINSNKLTSTDVTISNNIIKNPDSSLIWHFTKNGDYWTIFNESKNNYLASNGTKNQAQLLDAVDTDGKALWKAEQSVTKDKSTYFELNNKYNSTNKINSYLRCSNGDFACFSTGTGGSLLLFKKEITITDSISLNNGSQSISLTQGEVYQSTIPYSSEGTGEESIKLVDGIDVASLTLDTVNKAITINADKNVTGTGTYKLVKGTTESTETITITVNEPTNPLINFNYASAGIDEYKKELLLDETYEIPFTTTNCGENPSVTFESSNDSILVDSTNGNLQIITGSHSKITADTSFNISYVVKDADNEILNGSISFSVVTPKIKLDQETITVKENNSIDVKITLDGFDMNTISINLDTFESNNYTATLSEDKTVIKITGLIASSDDMLNIDVSDGTRTLNNNIYSVVINEVAKYNNDIYTKITSVSEIDDGQYVLVYEGENMYYAFNGKDEQNGYNSNTELSSNGIFDTVKLNITRNSDETYYLQINGGDNNGKYIGRSVAKSGIDISQDAQKNTISFDSNNILNIVGTGGYCILFNKATSYGYRFRYYSASNIGESNYGNVSLYKIDEANTSIGYANIFQNTLKIACSEKDENNRDEVNKVWPYLTNRFNNMPSLIQEELKNGTSTDTLVIEALSRYDHIVTRYGLNNFMNRSGLSAKNVAIFNNNTDSAITLIITITLTSVTLIASYFFIKKRKVTN